MVTILNILSIMIRVLSFLYCDFTYNLLYHMFAFISGGYHSWDEIFINHWYDVTMQARIQNFFKGGWIEEENFERKMYVDTRINACTHKN